jgi:hypothetical protein
MRIEAHIPISAVVSTAVYFVSKSEEIALISFLSGIFIDIDHIFDYFYCERKIKFDIKDFFYKCNYHQIKKYIFFLHSFELLLILAVLVYFFPSKILIGIFIGFTVHIFTDAFYKPKHFFRYSLIYRAKHNFINFDLAFPCLDKDKT